MALRIGSEIDPPTAAQEAGERGGWLSNVFPASSPAAAAAATRLNGSLTDDGALGPISGVMQAPLLDLTSAAKQTVREVSPSRAACCCCCCCRLFARPAKLPAAAADCSLVSLSLSGRE